MPTIDGTVYDPDGSAQQGASVTITDTDTDSVADDVTTDSSGSFSTTVADGSTYHVAVKYDDGSGNQYNAVSEPYITTDTTLTFKLREYTPPAQDAVVFEGERIGESITVSGSVSASGSVSTSSKRHRPASNSLVGAATASGSTTRSQSVVGGVTSTGTAVGIPIRAETISGPAVTLDETPVEGARITAIDSVREEYLRSVETDANGEWSLRVPEWTKIHTLAEFEDGTGQQYQEYSKPFVPVTGDGVPDEQNLLAHWDFSQVDVSDGETYGTVPDLSGNGHALTGQGATHTTEGINGLPAAYFDGSSGYLSGPTADVLDIGSDDITKSVYLAWQSSDASHVGYIMTQTINGTRSLQEFSHIFYGSLDKVDFSLGGTVTENSNIVDTNPHTTAALIDRPAGEATVSWDGTTQNTTTGSESPANTPIRLGARGAGGSGVGTFFHGYIGEVLVYDEKHDQSAHNNVMSYLNRWIE